MKYRDPTPTEYLTMFTRATELVAVQVGCSRDAAIDLMIERAETQHCSVGDLAIAIVEGTVRFGA